MRSWQGQADEDYKEEMICKLKGKEVSFIFGGWVDTGRAMVLMIEERRKDQGREEISGRNLRS